MLRFYLDVYLRFLLLGLFVYEIITLFIRILILIFGQIFL